MPSLLEIQEIRNATSGLALITNKEKALIEILECKAQSLVFQMPSAKIVLGHTLQLQGRMNLNDERVPFPVTGKVASLVELDKSQIRIEVQLIQYEKSLWKRFLKALLESQDHADHLLAVMKGEK